jgi:hypothetical protein
MKTLIQVAEVWVPDADGTLLEFGGGLYGNAPEFGAVSRQMCFGRGEGLPGRAWDEQRPILLKDLQGGYFQRAAAARKAGLACAAAWPVYAETRLRAVVVLFCGGAGDADAGAVELWHNDPRITTDLTLVDGYYGATPEDFAAASRETFLPRGSGLPGLAWQREGSVLLERVDGSSKFVRAEQAAAAGLQHGLALPCAVPANQNHVLVLLATPTMPIARRIRSWVRHGDTLVRADGFGEDAGQPLPAIAEAFAGALPLARAGMLALPLMAGGDVVEVLALHL